MFQRQLPNTERSAGQSSETSTMGFPICCDFFTFQPVPQLHATAGGKIKVVEFLNFDIIVYFNYILSLQELFEMMVGFQRMEKLEFGGLKGKIYNEQASQMYIEFCNYCQVLKQCEHSPLDCDSKVTKKNKCLIY